MATDEEIQTILDSEPRLKALKASGDDTKAQRFEDAIRSKLRDAPIISTAPNQAEQPTGLDTPVGTFVRPLLETGLGTLGTVIGARFGGPGGGIKGGVVGTTLGVTASDALETFAGERQGPSDLQGVASDTIKAVKTGVEQEAVGKAFGLAAKGIQFLKTPFKGKLTAAKNRTRQLAEDLGVTLSAADQLQSPGLALLFEGISERTPFSAGIIKKFRLGNLKKLVERRNFLLEKGGTSDALEETGAKVQNEISGLLDNLGIATEKAREKVSIGLIKSLGGKESFEQLGETGQKTAKDLLSTVSATVSKNFSRAMNLAGPDQRVATTQLNKVSSAAKEKFKNFESSNIPPSVVVQIKQFAGQGNKAFDVQQKAIEGAVRGASESVRNASRKSIIARLQARGIKIEKPGLTPVELGNMRKAINTAIDEVDQGLALTGKTGIKGVGNSVSSEAKNELLKFKRALDADVQAFADTASPEFKGALELARASSQEFKILANSPATKAFLKAKPQQAAEILAQSKDLVGIRNLKNAMGSGFKPVEEALANKIFGVGDDIPLTGTLIRGRLRKFNGGVVEAILGDGRTKQLRELARGLDDFDVSVAKNQFFKKLISSSKEKVVDLIIKPGNTANIKVIREALGQDTVTELAKAKANQILLKSGFNVPAEEFIVSPAKLLTGLRKLGDDTLNELFRHDKTFLKEIKELSEVANAAQGAAKVAANPSGTAQGIVAFGELALFLSNPISGLRLALGIPAVTKLYLSKFGRKLLTDGFKVNPNTPEAAAIFGRILDFTANERQDVSKDRRPVPISQSIGQPIGQSAEIAPLPRTNLTTQITR